MLWVLPCCVLVFTPSCSRGCGVVPLVRAALSVPSEQEEGGVEEQLCRGTPCTSPCVWASLDASPCFCPPAPEILRVRSHANHLTRVQIAALRPAPESALASRAGLGRWISCLYHGSHSPAKQRLRNNAAIYTAKPR